MRIGIRTIDDIALLKSREVSESSENIDTRLHLYSTNKLVDSHNDRILNSLPGPLRILEALDKLPETCAGLQISSDSRHTGGLFRKLCLKINCHVMLIRNVLVEHGLVNGALGIVTGFQENNSTCRPKAILVRFDDLALQIWASTEYTGCDGSVPIEMFEARFPLSPKRGTKAVEGSRLQFPIRPIAILKGRIY